MSVRVQQLLDRRMLNYLSLLTEPANINDITQTTLAGLMPERTEVDVSHLGVNRIQSIGAFSSVAFSTQGDPDIFIDTAINVGEIIDVAVARVRWATFTSGNPATYRFRPRTLMRSVYLLAA